MKKTLLMLVLLITTMAAMAKDHKTATFTTSPQMHCENCENKIKNNLRFEKGVKLIETSVENQTVTITYDPKKTDPERLLKGFEKIGYKARLVKEGEKIERNANEECTNM